MNWNVAWEVLTLILILNCVCGACTGCINTSKGYKGGFAWGFLLGVFGIIAVACRPYEINFFCEKLASFNNAETSQDDTEDTAPQQLSQQIICPSCGSPSPAESTFCPKCGRSLKGQ